MNRIGEHEMTIPSGIMREHVICAINEVIFQRELGPRLISFNINGRLGREIS